MGLTKRPDSYYVEFRVMESEDGKSLVLASGVPGARKKRWKVGCLNKTGYGIDNQDAPPSRSGT